MMKANKQGAKNKRNKGLENVESREVMTDEKLTKSLRKAEKEVGALAGKIKWQGNLRVWRGDGNRSS